jgi:septation ring formation regulator EzrA
MIRNRSRRMTIAQLEERMDTRFKAVDTRFDAIDKRFDATDSRASALDRKLDSIGDKLDAIAKRIDDKLDGHFQILHEHEERFRDLETWRRTTRDIAR